MKPNNGKGIRHREASQYSLEREPYNGLAILSPEYLEKNWKRSNCESDSASQVPLPLTGDNYSDSETQERDSGYNSGHSRSESRINNHSFRRSSGARRASSSWQAGGMRLSQIAEEFFKEAPTVSGHAPVSEEKKISTKHHKSW